MIKRKITERLERFFSDDGCYALLVDGARQVGTNWFYQLPRPRGFLLYFESKSVIPCVEIHSS